MCANAAVAQRTVVAKDNLRSPTASRARARRTPMARRERAAKVVQFEEISESSALCRRHEGPRVEGSAP